MSAITIEDELVHYEVLGRGKPIILIHGWLGSWRYWVPTMQQLAMKYRCYALDLWGFGDSGKDPARYSMAQQVELLDKFIDKMGIPKVVIVGHGLGAAVAGQYAVSRATGAKVHRMMVVAPPIVDTAPANQPTAKALPEGPGSAAQTVMNRSSLNIPPELSGKIESPAPAAEAPAAKKEKVSIQSANPLKDIFDGKALNDLLGVAIDSSSDDYEKLKKEIGKTDIKAVQASLEAFGTISTYRDLMAATAPVCALLGDSDGFMPKPDDAMLEKLDERSEIKIISLAESQHFPMLQDKAQFVRLLKDFLEAADIAALEMKEEWRRKKR